VVMLRRLLVQIFCMLQSCCSVVFCRINKLKCVLTMKAGDFCMPIDDSHASTSIVCGITALFLLRLQIIKFDAYSTGDKKHGQKFPGICSTFVILQ